RPNTLAIALRTPSPPEQAPHPIFLRWRRDKCLRVTRVCRAVRRFPSIHDGHSGASRWIASASPRNDGRSPRLEHGEVSAFLAVVGVPADDAVGHVGLDRLIDPSPDSPGDVRRTFRLRLDFAGGPTM